MGQRKPQRQRQFLPSEEQLEERFLLTRPDPLLRNAMVLPLGSNPVRPNTPVLPFAADFKVATFIDPTVRITNGLHIVVGSQTFIGPYATLDASGAGFIKMGSGDAILDNSSIIANPTHSQFASPVLVGDDVLLNFGAQVRGPSRIGAYGDQAQPTSIGANALIEGATIEPGAFVGALARVGPGVTVPSGMRVLPGKNVTTNAEASDPALGFVTPVVASDKSTLSKILSDNSALADGYTTLYQGNKATGLSIGVPDDVTNVFNGFLPAVTGSSNEPGSPTVKFEPPTQGPQYLSAKGFFFTGLFPQFRARVTGQAWFFDTAAHVAHHASRGDSIRADEGQPIIFHSAPTLDSFVSIHSPVEGQLVVGKNVQFGTGSVLLGGPLTSTTASVSVGDDVTIGPGAVVDRSNIGAGATIGARAFVSKSTVKPGEVIPPGTILVSDKVVGTIGW